MLRYFFTLYIFLLLSSSFAVAQIVDFEWTSPTCVLPGNGEVTITITGYTGNFEYRLFDEANGVFDIRPSTDTSMTYTGLAEGNNYIAYVKDVDLGIILEVQNNVLVAIPYKAELLKHKGAGCHGECVGSMEVNIEGGIPPYSVSWSDGVGGVYPNDTLITNLCVYSYVATVTDNIGCVISSPPKAITPEPAIVSVSNIVDVTCKGAASGKADASSSQTQAPVIYEWDDGFTGTQNTTLTGGSHYVVGTDGFGCFDTAYFAVTEPAFGIILTVDSTHDIACKGYNTGEAFTTSSFGVGSVSYSWTDGGSGGDRNNLFAGNHTVTATDQNGCSASKSLTILEPPTGIAGNVTSFSPPSCFGYKDGVATLTVAGGIAPRTVEWGDSWNDSTRFDLVRNDLEKRNYSLTFTDGDGCQSILFLNMPSPSIIQPELFLESDGSPANLSLKCFGDSVKVVVQPTGGTPPYTDYIWNNGIPDNDTVTLKTNSYNLLVRDNNGCEATTQIDVVSPAKLLGKPSINSPIKCFGQTGTLRSLETGGVGPFNYNWSDGSTNSITNPLTTGTYSLKITDANLCTDSTSINLPQPDTLALSFALDDALCQDVTLGTAIVKAVGGTAAVDYSYSWDSGDTNDTITGLSAQVYTVTVTDDKGCKTIDVLDLVNINNFDVAFAVKEVTCTGRSDGEITASAINGNLPLTYLWSDGETNPARTGLTVGWYKLTITDAMGCEAIDSIYLNTITPMVFVDKGTTETPCNEAKGSAYIDVAGGTEPYNYLWSNGGVTDSIVNLIVDFYSVQITDDNGCTISTILFVDDTSNISVDAITSDRRIRCKNAAVGQAVAKGNLGTPPYTFDWSTGFVGDTLKNIGAGFYSVRVTDVNMCQSTDTISFIEEKVLQTTIIDSSMITCNGLSNGWAVANALGGVSPYNVNWSNGSGAYAVTKLMPGWATVTITDKKGCVEKDSVLITEPLKISTVIDKSEAVSCGNTCDGNARVIASGGVGPYSYIWTSGEIDSAATFLCGGMSYVTITDSHSCTAIDSVVILDTLPKMGLNLFTTLSTCGIADGELAVTPFGGIKPYTYVWSNGITDSIIQNVRADVYSLVVTDNVGCDLDTLLILDDDSPIILNFTRRAITFCDTCNESYEADAILGLAPYSYVWSNGDTSPKADSLCVDQYFVTAEDQNQCRRSQLIDIPQKPLTLDLVSKTDVLCYGDASGAIDVIAGNGVSSNYTYSWSNGDNGATISSLIEGNYTVTVLEDSSVCPLSKSYSITQAPQTQVFFITDNASYCKDSTGILHVEVLGGTEPFSYLWQNGDADSIFENAWPEFITINITDGNACVITDSAKVTDVSDFALYEKSRYLISCLGDTDGKLEIGFTNGFSPFSYTWSHDVSEKDSLAEDLAPGVYSVIVKDSKNCVESFNFPPVTEPDTMKITFTETKPIFCTNGTGTLQANVKGGHPNYKYAWTYNTNPIPSSDKKVSNMAAGDFSVYAIDARGCVSTTSNYTFNNPLPIEAKYTVKLTGCGTDANTGEITIDTIFGPNPPYKFLWPGIGETKKWYDGVTDIHRTGLGAGEFFITIYDSLELCSEVPEKLYTYPIVVTDIDTLVTNTDCNYYTQQQYDDFVPKGKIEITSLMTEGGSPQDRTDTIRYTNFNGFTFAWEDHYLQTTSTAENLASGLHYVTITNSNQCTSRILAGEILARKNLNIAIQTLEDTIYYRKTICFGDSLQLRSTVYETFLDGYKPADNTREFSWFSRSQNTFADLSATTGQNVWAKSTGEYYTDSSLIVSQYRMDGCTSPEGLFSLSSYDSIGFNLEFYDHDNYLIEGDSNFVIQELNFAIEPTVQPWFIDKDPNKDGFVSIHWTTLNPTKTREGQQKDTITNETSYINSGNYGLHLIALAPSYYIASAYTTHNCVEKDVVFMHVFQDLFVPTGITPNGDGDNDVWIIPYLYSCPDASVKVFNRWGVKIYESEGIYYKNPWNGTNKKGDQVALGTYYYIIEYNNEEGTQPQAGSITVLY